MAASMAPKRTTCDFGGSGTEKRKGCQFPLKNSARAHSVDAVLEAVSRSGGEFFTISTCRCKFFRLENYATTLCAMRC